MNKRIALTGATGFVGSHLLDELVSRGYDVNALTRRSQPTRSNVNWISGDFDDQEALDELLKDVRVVINVAGLVKANSKDAFANANTRSVEKLLRACDRADKSLQFIHISTLAAREENISNYADSKYNGEKALTQTIDTVNWTILRPPAVYGPTDKETLKIFKLLKWRIALIPTNPDHRVSWIHVSDLASAIISLIDNERYSGKILEIDDGAKNGYSHEEFYRIASDILNIKPLTITFPKFLLKIMGHTNDLFGTVFNYAPMLSAKKVNELCHHDWVCNKSGDLNDEDWQAQYDLRKGLKQTLDWYKNNKYI